MQRGSKHPHPHPHVIRVDGHDETGALLHFTTSQVIRMRGAGHSFYTWNDESETPVRVAKCHTCSLPTLRSDTDTSPDDHLAEVPGSS